jgi:hypothetical protein
MGFVMPNIPRKAERIILADTILKLERIFRGTMVPPHPAQSDMVFISIGVFYGHVTGKPFTAHKLALFLNVPRPTLVGRLEWLVEHGYVERRGRVYCSAAHIIEKTPIMDRAIELLTEGGDKLRALRAK